MPKVFLITGTSTGFGANLVQEVIDRGDIAVATARKPDSLEFKNTNKKVCIPSPCFDLGILNDFNYLLNDFNYLFTFSW